MRCARHKFALLVWIDINNKTNKILLWVNYICERYAFGARPP